ncbi:hypothetical protein QFZ55_002070 [Streptomyces luteogriseus]|nr:hypothetical protein [Streptomyces luteogriseus]
MKPEISDQSSGRSKSLRSPAKYASTWRIASASSGEPGASTGSVPSRDASRSTARSRTASVAWNTTLTRPSRLAASSSGPIPLSTTAQTTRGSTCSRLSMRPQ